VNENEDCESVQQAPEELSTSEVARQTAKEARARYEPSAPGKPAGQQIHERRKLPPVPAGEPIADESPSPPVEID